MRMRYGRLVRRFGRGRCTTKFARAWLRASRGCAHCLRRPSGEAWIRPELLCLPEVGRDEITSLRLQLWTTLTGIYGLFWGCFPARLRSIGGTPNYGTRQSQNSFQQSCYFINFHQMNIASEVIVAKYSTQSGDLFLCTEFTATWV
jgi:hypothetical protein